MKNMSSGPLRRSYVRRSYSKVGLGVLFSWLGAISAAGLAPHELLVLANRHEPASVRIAQTYIRERSVPRQNLILVSVPPDDAGDYVSISRENYTRQIWEPVQTAIRLRGLEHVLGWVFSTHLPYRVDGDPPVSVQGLTFVRNQLPSREAIAKAEYESPLFAGPSAPNSGMRLSHSLFPASQVLGAEMPIPSMALGYIGPRGNREEEVLAMLARSRSADASAPSGTVYFVEHEDEIRSRVRAWQFAPVVAMLQRMGVEAVITNKVPVGAPAVLGVMLGAREVDPSSMGVFLPGAVGEHLTSFGATFDLETQTKISRWIAAGVSGTAGTVTEPYAVWAKFPHARFYVHYRSGATLLESFYLSLRTPLQTFLLGDPLTAPWAPAAHLRIGGLEEGEVVAAARSIDIHIQAPRGTHYARFLYLINGRVVGEGTSFVLDPMELPPGLHVLRAVAYRAGHIQSPVFGEVRFQIAP